jgi:hypothetical protein
MTRELLTRREYLAELNRQLRSHPAYVEGMHFVTSPGLDPETATGIDWVLPDGVAPPQDLFPMIAAEVHATYSVQADALLPMPPPRPQRDGTF